MDTKKTNQIEKVEMTKEENKAQLQTHEKDILKGLLEANNCKVDEDSIRNVEVARNGKVLFSFRIRPLSEEEYYQCREKHTKYIRNKALGIKMPEHTDTVRYRSALIYQATIDEDRAKVWDNREAWKELNVLSGIDLIDKTLLAGEKDAVLDLLDKISGYSETTEEVAKN